MPGFTTNVRVEASASGLLNAWIDFDANGVWSAGEQIATDMAVVAGGKEAITNYRVEERYRAHALVRVSLETGRTHQIRVHFAYRRHALVGDPGYGGRLALPAGASDDLIKLLRRWKRQALHAARLSFVHPVTAQQVEFEVPAPADFQELIAVMRDDASKQ